MFLKKWEEMPETIKNEFTYAYYKKLENKKFALMLKRSFDIFFSIILLFVLFPLIVIVGICIKIDSKGPIFYKQERVTQYNRVFTIFKFRTMIENADKIGTLVTLNQDSRITRIGKFIRKFRIDEIPQLINILIGDMSFVGTRPEVKKYVDCYTNEMMATLLMPAGVTSYASIAFKDEDELIRKYMEEGKKIDDIYAQNILPQKMKYNLEYIQHFSCKMDLAIIIKTVLSVFFIKKKEKITIKNTNKPKEILK